MSALHEQLASDGLLQIGATTAHAQLDSLAQQAAAHHWSYSHFLGRLLEAEIAARRQRVIETSLHFSGLPWQKRLGDFDFSFQPSIDRALIEELATGRFLDEGRNVIFQGPPGVGKTHLAIALGLCCAERGQRLLFLGAMELARRMKTAFAANRMPHYLKMLTTPKLLIVDEVGYLGLDHDQASLLFQVICQRYEKQAATIITSNKAFSDWGHVFAGDAVMASAALDRLLHRATVVNIKGESYRMKEKRLTGLFPGSVALPDAPTKGGPRSKTK
jgi:DNA replication protein DnaC